MRKKAKAIGSDLAKIDAHVIRPHEYDDNPEWTEEDIARADVHQGGTLIQPDRGGPKLEAPKRQA